MAPPLFHRHWGASTSDSPSPSVVVIHGLFGSMENLGMITRLLKDDFSVYGVDLPNHGRSPQLSPSSLSAMADSVFEWMDSVGLASAYFLGHSLGGKVVMELALRYPQRVKALIVADIAPVAYPRRHDDMFEGFEAVDLKSLKSRGEADLAMKDFVGEASTRSFLLKNLEKTDAGWQWRINLRGLKEDYEEYISANSVGFPPYQQPVLFIKGERSDYILPEYRETILDLFPSADVKIINDTEHWLHAEKPELFTRIVKRFLAKVSSELS